MIDSIPSRAGIGLRSPHYAALLESLPDIGWLEIHGENYLSAGGLPHLMLERLRAHYPLSMHCVGLSLGSADGVDLTHLQKLKTVAARYAPHFVSDHLSWGAVDGIHFNDLLPLPYTEEALNTVCNNVTMVQDVMGRTILLENVSSYLTYRHSTIAEWDFINEVSRRTGCGILLDINNIYVNAVNHGFNASDFLRSVSVAAVKELHLAGFENGNDCLIDTHSQPVADVVWELFAEAVRRFGQLPTLIEWDAEIPPLDILLQEAAKADYILSGAQDASLAA